jgi:hypothetical protein
MNQHLFAKIQEALQRIEPMNEKGWPPAESIARQLRWCAAFVSGQQTEKRPGPFSMGLMATRELDMYGDQPDLATLINEIQREVESKLS